MKGAKEKEVSRRPRDSYLRNEIKTSNIVSGDGVTTGRSYSTSVCDRLSLEAAKCNCNRGRREEKRGVERGRERKNRYRTVTVRID